MYMRENMEYTLTLLRDSVVVESGRAGAVGASARREGELAGGAGGGIGAGETAGEGTGLAVREIEGRVEISRRAAAVGGE